MVTDDERREVAQRLRELEKCVIGALIPTGELAENILRAIDYGHSGAMTPYGCLADLIEPSGHECVPGECSINVRHDNDRIDRNTLLELADEMERMPQCELCPAEIVDCSAHPDGCTDALLDHYARRIREALDQGRR